MRSLDSSHLTSDQMRRLRKRIEPMQRYLGKLIYRCRELQFLESDPLLAAALLAAMKLDDLDREAMRAGLRPHGTEKIELDMSKPDVQMAK